MRELSLECPGCGLPITTSVSPEGTIDFTRDLDIVEAVLDGEFNTFIHFCGASYSVFQPCVAVNPPRQLLVTVGEPITDLPETWSASSVVDYESLSDVFAQWLLFEFQELLRLFKDGSLGELDRAALIDVVSAVRLVAAGRVAAGANVSAQTADERANAEGLARLHNRLVQDQLDRITLDSLETSQGSDLLERVRRHIPTRCLTDAVLTGLLDRCDDGAFEPVEPDAEGETELAVPDRARLATAFRRELGAAVAHHAAGRTNPRGDSWAEMIVGLWAISTLDNVEIDDRFFPDPALLQATIQFDHLVSPAMRLMLPAEPTSFTDAMDAVSDLREKFAPLMKRAGYARVFDEQVEALYAWMLKEADLHFSVPVAIDDMFARLDDRNESQEGSTRAESAGLLAAQLLARTATAWPQQTASLAREIRDHLVATQDLNVLIAFTFNATQWLNQRGFHDVALELVEPILPSLTNVTADLGQAAEVNFWNEVGNTYRYAHRADEAIDAYERSAAAIHGLPDADRRHQIIRRNIAIVLRESGDFVESIDLIDEMLDAHPDDASLLHTAAVTRLVIGQFEEAVQLLEHMHNLPALSLHQRVLAIATKVEALIRLGRADQCLVDLHPLWTAPGLEVDQRMRVAALAVQITPHDEVESGFRDACARFIESEADELEGAPGVVAALHALAVGHLERGELQAARAALEKAIPAPRSVSTPRPGVLDLAWGWLRLEEGGDDAVSWLRSAMATLDGGLPRAEQQTFALSWMSLTGSMIDQLVDLVPRATTDPRVLLELYELANGLELTAGTADQHPATGTDWASELAQRLEGRPVDVLAIIDGSRLTAVLIKAGTSESTVIEVPLSADVLAAAVGQLAWFDLANPVAPERVDGAMRLWWEVMGTFADSIRPHLTHEAELIILPGRRLSGTPLHAAGWPGDPLVATRPVSVSPNFRVLLDRSGPARPRHAGIVVIPKHGDREDFARGLQDVADELSGLLAPTTRAVGIEADAAAVVALAETVDEIVFLAHGVSAAGPNQGAGICVSGRGRLPPDVLPVDADPTLGDFVLSWADLIRLDEAPDVVVSIACSSGRVMVGPGGSRLGLEQGFLTRGGAAIVSPLWNVAQTASLAWLRGFYPHHRPGKVEDLASAFRSACEDLWGHYPHPYHWAPFLLTRRLDGVEP